MYNTSIGGCMFNKFDNIGKILIVNNISFKDVVTNKIEADHCSLSGRPCIVLDEIEDKMYLLPLTSKLYYGCFQPRQFCIHKWDVIDDDLPNTKYIKLTPIIERDIFSDMTHGELTPLTYYRLLKYMIELYQNRSQKKYLDFEMYNKIKPSISEKVLKLEKMIGKTQEF